LADLRVGLSFDEPEVKEKLAKALEHVALGNPDRLRHKVSSLAEHLDDESELVRYHLCTALVVIGCAYPAKLADASEAVTGRLSDENPHVRGRAAEALGLLAGSAPDETAISAADVPDVGDEAEPFVADRVRFARTAFAEGGREGETPEEIGTVEGIRGTTDEVVEEITSLDGDGECPHCGLSLPENGPPMCPQCGAPY
jgi:HEAT repeat protein